MIEQIRNGNNDSRTARRQYVDDEGRIQQEYTYSNNILRDLFNEKTRARRPDAHEKD